MIPITALGVPKIVRKLRVQRGGEEAAMGKLLRREALAYCQKANRDADAMYAAQGIRRRTAPLTDDDVVVEVWVYRKGFFLEVHAAFGPDLTAIGSGRLVKAVYLAGDAPGLELKPRGMGSVAVDALRARQKESEEA